MYQPWLQVTGHKLKCVAWDMRELAKCEITVQLMSCFRKVNEQLCDQQT